MGYYNTYQIRLKYRIYSVLYSILFLYKYQKYIVKSINLYKTFFDKKQRIIFDKKFNTKNIFCGVHPIPRQAFLKACRVWDRVSRFSIFSVFSEKHRKRCGRVLVKWILPVADTPVIEQCSFAHSIYLYYFVYGYIITYLSPFLSFQNSLF